MHDVRSCDPRPGHVDGEDVVSRQSKLDTRSSVDEICKTISETNDRAREAARELAKFQSDMAGGKEFMKGIEAYNDTLKKCAELGDQLLANQEQVASIIEAGEASMKLGKEWARTIENFRRKRDAFLHRIAGPIDPQERAFGTHILEAVEIIKDWSKDWSSEKDRSKKNAS